MGCLELFLSEVSPGVLAPPECWPGRKPRDTPASVCVCVFFPLSVCVCVSMFLFLLKCVFLCVCFPLFLPRFLLVTG